MAEEQKGRHKHEQGMLDNIGGRDAPSENSVEPTATASIGWMGYVGGFLWITVFCGVSLIAWLFFAK